MTAQRAADGFEHLHAPPDVLLGFLILVARQPLPAVSSSRLIPSLPMSWSRPPAVRLNPPGAQLGGAHLRHVSERGASDVPYNLETRCRDRSTP